MKEDMVKKAVIDAWDIYMDGMLEDKRNKKDKKGNKKDDESRSKIKSMAGGLRQFTEPNNSVLHFIKYIEYALPRSDFNRTLEQILKKIAGMREEGLSDEEIRERLQYTVGYLAWTSDALQKMDKEVMRRMIRTEFAMIGMEGEENKYIEKIEASFDSVDKGRRRY